MKMSVYTESQKHYILFYFRNMNASDRQQGYSWWKYETFAQVRNSEVSPKTTEARVDQRVTGINYALQ